APYLSVASRSGSKSNGASIFRCPSDAVELHQVNLAGRPPYPFSYSMNAYCCDNGRAYAHLANNSTKNFKIGLVRKPSQKIMLIDESEKTVNDGLWVPEAYDYDQLADRHHHHHDDQLQNDGSLGNVGFFDGHAQQVTRLDARNPLFWDPLQ
ncbi:MAG: hypothetical protein JWP03_1558, partial [Phycisphaerales bacterium]|nr:hypothetical protein [Phycisphaerales bacterium]